MFSLVKHCAFGLVRNTSIRNTPFPAIGSRIVSTIKTSNRGTASSVPVIDLGKLGLDYEPDPKDGEWQRVAREITDAFKTIGFAYISGHGFPDAHVNRITKAGETFFDFPENQKMDYLRDLKRFHGYLPINSERADESYSLELRESFDLRDAAPDSIFPDNVIPDFRQGTADFLESCRKLAYRILGALSFGLDLHPSFFIDAHKGIGSYENRTIGRLIHYPPIPDDTSEGTIRIGPHSDFTTVTLLFQDNVGGLQILDPNDNWTPAAPIPGTIVVNIGDLLQFWTGGKLRATKHRVVLPKDERKRVISRRSLAYFVVSDDSVVIKPIDGSNSFEPIMTKDYINKRLSEVYKSQEKGKGMK